MMALNYLTCDIQRLDTVGIDGTLPQPLRIRDLLSLSVEHLDEVTTDDLTLLFRIRNTGQVGKELLAGIHTDHVKTQHFIVVHYLCELVLAKHAMIHEDTSEVLSNGLVQQDGSHRRVNTT